MYQKIDHVAIAVRSIRAALEVYAPLLSLESVHVEEVVDQKTRVALLPIGESRIELLEPMTEESTVHRYLERRGEGIHHLCFRVDDIRAELEKLKKSGIRLIDEVPREGADHCLVAFIHPSAANGVLIELSQRMNPAHGS